MPVVFTDYMLALRSSGLPGPTRSVALWIATRCANDWSVTTETIAGDSGFSPATVKRHVATLESMGWLKRQSDRIKGNRYELLIPDISLAQSEPTDGSERANEIAQSEPSTPKGWLRASQQMVQSEPTDGSERANGMAQSEPTYIRTKQEHTKTNKNLARTPVPVRPHARERGVTDGIQYSDLNQGLLWTWVKELEKVPEAKNEVLRFKSYRTPENEIYKNAFVTALLTSERLFEHFRPWFEQLKEEGRI